MQQRRWGRRRGWRNQREREVRIRKEGRGGIKFIGETDKTRRRFDEEVTNVARNPIGTVPNAPLASAPGKEFHPPILGTLEIHGGQVNIENI